MENANGIVSSRWHDNGIFIIHFAPRPSAKDFGVDGVTEEVCMFYHKELGVWSINKLYLDGDGNCLSYDSDTFPPDEREKYVRIGELELEKKNMEKNIDMAEDDKEKSYKDKVFEWVCSNAENLRWVRDESSTYSDYECKIEDGLTLRVVSNREGQYLQILQSCSNYRIYDAKDYPKVGDILQIARRQWCDERDEEFFKGIYEKLDKAI